jgi:DNA helicase TIP49 (TBP-interacting protein)
MYAETFRPTVLEEVIGHIDAKQQLCKYLGTAGFSKAIMLTGSPGIGKTTLALAAARTPLESIGCASASAFSFFFGGMFKKKGRTNMLTEGVCVQEDLAIFLQATSSQPEHSLA